jgi:UDP-glucose 6-dehydrogenase
MSTLLTNLDLSTAIPEATSRLNDKHNEFLVEKILSRIGSETLVGLIGYSYKPDTSVYEESTGYKLADILVANGKSVNVWEPLMANREFESGESIIFVENLRSLSTCGALVITRLLSQEEIEAVLQEIESGLVLDPWRQISRIQLNTLKPSVVYLPIGREL